jgi:aspartyl-tRNA(Asn)/glutamyl-tRNA(Gln) amidotransferase subunit A
MGGVLARIDRLEPQVGAFVTRVDPEACLAQAREAEAEIQARGYRGKLHGIPLGVKDTHYTAGIRTTARSPILGDFVPEWDATVVTKLKAAGAIIVGKTNLPEFSMGGATPGTHNPWDLRDDPGGSSGGSAAAIAADMLIGATGGDTGGSIRSPSIRCGVVGLKPTYGRVSLRGIVPISWSLDHVGPITKTVEDAALLLNGIAGHDPEDATSSRAPVPVYNARLRRGVRGWRIGVPGNALLEGQSAENLGAFAAALEVFRGRGATVQEIALPSTFGASYACQRIIRIAEAAAYHRHFLRSAADYGSGSTVRRQVLAGSLLSSSVYQRAQQVRAVFIREMRTLFEEIDVMVTPGWETSADTRGFASAPLLSAMWNLCGFPAIVIPAGFTSGTAGRPLGIQIAGRPFEEETILTAAHTFEQATEWHTRRPEL